MRIDDISGWYKLTYTLLYPAVLGSMLFDVLNSRSYLDAFGNMDLVAFTKLSIVLFYCLDYLHLNVNLKANSLENARWCNTILDGLVAILIGIAYWQVIHEAYIRAFLLLFIVAAILLFYELNTTRKNPRNIIGHFTLVIILSVGLLLFKMKLIGLVWHFYAVIYAPTLFYSIHIFWIWRNRKRLQTTKGNGVSP